MQDLKQIHPGLAQVPTGSQNELSLAKSDPSRYQPQVYWYLSFRCNLACSHCWVNSSPDVDTSKDLKEEDIEMVISRLVELDVGGVILTGGEVLLRRDALKIIRAITDAGMGVGVETNSLLIKEPFIALALDLQKRGLLSMSISLDGGTPETHEKMRGKKTFALTLAKMRLLRDKGVKFSFQCVLNRENLHTIPQLFALAAELSPNLERLQFAFLNPIGRGKELVNDIGIRREDYFQIFTYLQEEILRDNDFQVIVAGPPAITPPPFLSTVFHHPRVTYNMTCPFPILGILPNGDVTICAMSRDNEDLYFGNIREISLKEIWDQMGMLELRDQYLRAQTFEGVCGDCIWKLRCKGGCRAHAYEEGGSFEASHPICVGLNERGEFPNLYRISKHAEKMGTPARLATVSAEP